MSEAADRLVDRRQRRARMARESTAHGSRRDCATFGAARQMIVSWLRAGHTRVLSGVGLRSDELLELAAWNGSMDNARRHTGLSPALQLLAA